MVTLQCHISFWILDQRDLRKFILTKHSLVFAGWALNRQKNQILPVPLILKFRKDKKGWVRKLCGMKAHRRWCFLWLKVWFGSLLLDVLIDIAKCIWFCSLDIFMSSFFRKYILPTLFSSLLWQRRMQVLNILRPCSAMAQQKQVFFIIHLTQE